jgi:ferric-dicitrate binding protein FerR (iron transport regulator)
MARQSFANERSGAPDASSLIEQAIAWSIALASGTATEEQLAACQCWRDANPEHEQAWQQVQVVEQTFHQIPTASEQLAYRVLQASGQKKIGKSRRLAIKALGALVVVAIAIPLVLLMPWQKAEYRTAIGERGSFTLSDGTSLQLNTDSLVAVEYSLLRRRLLLQHGEILIATSRDAEALFGRRSFWVATDGALLEAIGTRFNVRRLEGETHLTVIEGAVAVRSNADRDTVVRAGEAVAVAPDVAVLSVHRVDTTFDPTAWADGVLVAKQMRLDALVAELVRYRRAPVRYDPEISGMQVSGVFQLNGVDPVGRTLTALARALPVRIEHSSDGGVELRKIN